MLPSMVLFEHQVFMKNKSRENNLINQYTGNLIIKGFDYIFQIPDAFSPGWHAGGQSLRKIR